jgi:hypothetical protein
VKAIFWIVPGELAGRPGPELVPWDLAALQTGGIGAVLSVNEGIHCRRSDFEALGLPYACIPLSSNAPPQPGDLVHCLSTLPRAYGYVEEQRAQGRAVLVHCTSGKDRTGLFGAYYLMKRLGLDPEAAFARTRELRPIAFSAWGWSEFAMEVLRGIR